MENKTLLIAISSQKGGVGKSALTALTASYLHYTRGKEIAVMDCDYPQYSIARLREREDKLIRELPERKKLLLEQYQRTGKRSYTIQRSKPEEAVGKAVDLISQSQIPLDAVLFDLSGTVNSIGNLRSILNMDYIFIPFIADKMVMESTLSFSLALTDFKRKMSDSPLKGIYHFWNKVDKRESSDLYNHYTEISRSYELQVLSARISETKRYKKELSEQKQAVFRSTLFPPDKQLLRGSGLEELMDEMCHLTGL